MIHSATEREIDAGPRMLGLVLLLSIDVGIWAIVALMWLGR
jgi:hypothetical protein